MTATLNRLAPHVLSLLRVMAALLILQYGLRKVLGFPPGDNIPSLTSLPGIAGIFELVCGGLILIGLFTRPAAFVLSGVMAFAYFLRHAPQDFYPINNNGNLAILFCFVFFYFVFSGAGPWSVDRVIGRA
ncbi:DoxX family protein [Ancylobacter sp. G4_0304]|uniref:DoxX family protein n=1 Tax=Ancylobacter sp. G4_0304 TaxID=3114289 RepID=UPI0039C5EF92